MWEVTNAEDHFVLLIIIIKNHVFHIKAESSLVEEVCQVAREEEEQLVLLVQVMEDMAVVDAMVIGGGDSFFFKKDDYFDAGELGLE